VFVGNIPKLYPVLGAPSTWVCRIGDALFWFDRNGSFVYYAAYRRSFEGRGQTERYGRQIGSGGYLILCFFDEKGDVE
jgi:hypothetical protein